MPLMLPASPLPKSASPRPLVFGGWLTPTGGGDEQFLQRLGSRWALDVVTPDLLPEPEGRAWTAILAAAWFNGDTVIYPVPQPGLRTTGSGSPVVDGAGQAGSSLALRGLTPGYAIAAGQFLSFWYGYSAPHYYLHRATATVAADSGGHVVVPIVPLLRPSPNDGALCQLDTPLIEGKATGNARSWTMIPARVQSLQFSIEEIR